MKTAQILILLVLPAGAFWLNGCATETKPVQGEIRPAAVTDGHRISPVELSYGAEKLCRKLLVSGVLDRVSNAPMVIVFSGFANHSRLEINTDRLNDKLRAFVEEGGGGKIILTKEAAIVGQPAQPLPVNTGKEVSGSSGPVDAQRKGTPMAPYTLVGRIDESRFNDSVIYSFRLSLSTGEGVEIWEAVEEIGICHHKPNKDLW